MNPFRETIVASPWDAARVDVPSIHGAVFESCMAGIEQVQESRRSAGLVIHGEAGSGKTHLLGRLRSRLMLDISGFRADKRTRLTQLGTETAAEVAKSGEPVSLEPMTPFERKIVHDAVAAAGLRSESAGVEPRRYVVVLPA